MNSHFKTALGCLLCLCFTGCGDDAGDTPCDPQTFITACKKDMGAMLYCDVDGKVKSRNCEFGCDAPTGTCKKQDGSVMACSNASYPAACVDDTTRTFCNNGVKDRETCAPGLKCIDGACSRELDNRCTGESYPDTCTDRFTRTYCNNSGIKSFETCPGKCADGLCVDENASETCDAKYKARCESPLVLASCKDGKVVRERCQNGTICNSALKTAQCKKPEFHENCDPATFSESCTKNDTQAITCDPDTNRIVFITCEKQYGEDYKKCDIRENFYGPGMNAVMCYSKAEACDNEGDLIYDYCWNESEINGSKYRKFYKETYTCTQFNTGHHMYFTQIEECPGHGYTKCGQDKIKRQCADVSNAIETE